MLLTLLLTVGEALASDGSSFRPYETSLLDRGISLLGIFGFVGIAWLISEDRSRVNWKTIGWAVGLQLIFGLIVLNDAVSGIFYTVINGGVNQLLSFAEAGTAFVLASISPHRVMMIDPSNPTAPPTMVDIGLAEMPRNNVDPGVKSVAFFILPTIIFFSALMSLLYHIGVMSVVIRGLTWVMVRTLGTSGAESLSAAGNIFVGQTEAPLLVKPFVAKMTRSELMAVMTGGFATVAGGVMGTYVSFLKNDIPDIAGHLVIASIISAPAALAMAKTMVPETEQPETAGVTKIELEKSAGNAIEAAAIGASDGMTLVLNVAAMLIAIVALVALADSLFWLLPVRFCEAQFLAGYASECVAASGDTVATGALDMSRLLGWVFMPVALMMGVPWGDVAVVGQLLGEKIVLTELLAYLHLAQFMSGDVPVLSERAAIISSYALCGFANFASIGIQLGGIGGIAPERMGDLSRLGLRAMLAGAMAACMTGAVAGIFL